jgi:DNA-directed RNA polymerase subunit H (RpoH/RPB5)
MSIIEKVAKTRQVLKEILEDQQFDVSSIELLSNEEISKLYDLQSTESLIDSLGYGSAGCNFSVKHDKIPSYILNVIYLNLPDRDSSSSRLSKSFKDKIYKLYESEILNKYSSCIIIINEKITETIEKTIQELNISLQNELDDIPDDIQKEMETNDYYLKQIHFRRCWIFNINTLTINLKKHRLVSEHLPIHKEEDIQEILSRCNCSKQQLPVISKNDIMVKYNLSAPGDIMKINRTSKMTGNYPFYRFVR